MNRRSFFGAVFAGAGATTLPAAVPLLPAQWPSLQQPVHYNGYMIYWTGWKPQQDRDLAFGQWLAWPLRGFGLSDYPSRQPYLYLTVPTFVGGPYQPGACFYLGGRGGRYMNGDVTIPTSDAWIHEGLTYIKLLVDKYRDRTGPLESYWLHSFANGVEEGSIG